jgi:pimeloyl-ACP methyl ester carboxylesterase
VAKLRPAYGLLRIAGTGDGERAVVVLHGIRQTRDHLRPFAERVGQNLPPGFDLYLYGYNHTQGLEPNGRFLAAALWGEFEERRIDLIGYSMGGLVARLAATEDVPSPIHTVITLATPNRGSLSNPELTVLGQIGRTVFETISPLVPRAEGVKDLTRTASIMADRRRRLLERLSIPLSAKQRRYASIPALFYHIDNPEFAFGPSLSMSGLQALLKLQALRVKLISMKRSHDGIVTEKSNNIAQSETHEWPEFTLTRDAADGSPARCHAVADTCRDHDHSSILADELVPRLAAALILSNDWRELRSDYRQLALRTRLYPFDAQ